MSIATVAPRRYVVLFAPSYEAAREYAKRERLRFGWWTFACRTERLPRRDPEFCETVTLPGYEYNRDVFAAKQQWEQRRRKKHA
jgi:hypothetical protein